jgi:hypothetical protein
MPPRWLMEPERLHQFFGRCWFINLDYRSERREAFEAQFIPPEWPFRTPERFRAIDGRLVHFPAWWGAGPGAWGVMRSNVRIIEDCLNEHASSVLILEDDAMLCQDFAAKVERFLDHVPDDWEMLYLGGQHLDVKNHPPTVINERVVRPWNVNRCHAYALRGSGLLKAYGQLMDRRWAPKHHIDHRYGLLHQDGGIKVYAPSEWLIGQRGGVSDICHLHLPDRSWTGRMGGGERDSMPLVVAVLGPYRGGTSATAGAMHHLGINMGPPFFPGRIADSPRGCYESLDLYRACMRCFPEPKFVRALSGEQRTHLLRDWLRARQHDSSLIGAKHPKLCLMIPEMLAAWPDCKFVVVDRDQAESARSLTKVGWWNKHQDPAALINRLVGTRDRDLATVPADRVLRIAFRDLVRQPRDHLERIAVFVGIAPAADQMDTAVAHIDSGIPKHMATPASGDA